MAAQIELAARKILGLINACMFVLPRQLTATDSLGEYGARGIRRVFPRVHSFVEDVQ